MEEKRSKTRTDGRVKNEGRKEEAKRLRLPDVNDRREGDEGCTSEKQSESKRERESVTERWEGAEERETERDVCGLLTNNASQSDGMVSSWTRKMFQIILTAVPSLPSHLMQMPVRLPSLSLLPFAALCHCLRALISPQPVSPSSLVQSACSCRPS